MAKSTTINYPTQEWLDNWVDKYLEKHPNEKVTDFQALEDMASAEWWDNEIDHDRPTPFDMTDEQKKDQKKIMNNGVRKVSGEKVVRERKKDEEKAEIIAKIAEIFSENAKITNNEREISLKIGENDYSITLIKHRPPKK